MNRGFISLGINTEKDRIKYCYGLALSLKLSDPEAEFCLVVDQEKSDSVPEEYHHAFDYIVELPYGNTAYKDGFHGMNLWQLYHCTPFERTIYLDADTILHNVDVDDLWESLESYDIAIPSNAFTFRNLPAAPWPKFDFEDAYKLPKNYNNMIYWRSETKEAAEWFKMADPIMQNWRSVYNKFFTEKKPESFNKNILCNLITHCVDMEDEVKYFLGNHYDINTQNQGVWHEEMPEGWTDLLNVWISDNGKIQIENSVMNNGIIHYSDENFLNQRVIDVFRTRLTERQERG